MVDSGSLKNRRSDSASSRKEKEEAASAEPVCLLRGKTLMQLSSIGSTYIADSFLSISDICRALSKCTLLLFQRLPKEKKSHTFSLTYTYR